MKKVILVLFIVAFKFSFAQAKKESSTKTETKTATPAKASANNQANALVGKDWKLAETEKWGVIKGPTDENKNDHFVLNADETFSMFLKTKERKGTWKKAGSNINFTCEDGEKLVFRILKSEPGKLKIDWREDETMNTLITFTSGK